MGLVGTLREKQNPGTFPSPQKVLLDGAALDYVEKNDKKNDKW